MNRVIPSFVEDEDFNKLSLKAEVFFRRLWNEADDLGRFDARPLILKSRLYPLSDIRLPDISRCLAECEAVRLIACYEVDGKPYIQISRFWNQNLARSKPKYPEPPDNLSSICNSNDTQMNVSCSAEDETEIEDEKRNIKEKLFLESAERIWQAYPKKDGKKEGLIAILKRLKEGLTEEYLIERVKAYAVTVSGQDKRYIKNAQGWFNQERYKDTSLDNPTPPKESGDDFSPAQFAKAVEWVYDAVGGYFPDGESPEKSAWKFARRPDATMSEIRKQHGDVYAQVKVAYNAPFSKLKQFLQKQGNGDFR